MQSPDFSQSYFELFGLKPVFEIDLGNLHAQQKRLQATYHPDRFVHADERDRRLSVQAASWVNQAYQTLRDPVKRSRYLLELNGTLIPDDSTTTSDTDFLMEQIELREAVEACKTGEDAVQRCEQVETRLASRADQLAQEFVTHFTSADYEAALHSSRKMQFIQRIQQQLADLQFELEEF